MPEVPKGCKNWSCFTPAVQAVFNMNIISKFLNGRILKLDYIRFLISKLPPFWFIPLLSSGKKKHSISTDESSGLINKTTITIKSWLGKNKEWRTFAIKDTKLKEVKTISSINLKSRSWRIEFIYHAFHNKKEIVEFILVSNYFSRFHASNVSTILTTAMFKKPN